MGLSLTVIYKIYKITWNILRIHDTFYVIFLTFLYTPHKTRRTSQNTSRSLQDTLRSLVRYFFHHSHVFFYTVIWYFDAMWKITRSYARDIPRISIGYGKHPWGTWEHLWDTGNIYEVPGNIYEVPGNIPGIPGNISGIRGTSLGYIRIYVETYIQNIFGYSSKLISGQFETHLRSRR